MLKKSAKIAVVGTLSFGMITIGGLNFASATVKEYNSDAKINFEENTEETNPVDPEEPEKEVDPNDKDDNDNEDAKKGPLSIDYASSLDFGDQKISSEEQTYNVNPVIITDKDGNEDERAPYVQVTDKRGSLAGWQVSVAQDSQLETEEGAILEGAEITMESGHVTGTQDTEGIDANNAITLGNFGESYDLFDAEENSGAGTFLNSFGDEGDNPEDTVSLTVPGGSKIEEENYSANLTWTLTDAPK